MPPEHRRGRGVGRHACRGHCVRERSERADDALFADRRHLRRRLYDRPQHRRRHRGRSHQDRFREQAPGHTYSITVQANDGVATTSQSFTIGVTDVAPSAPVDNDASTNSVVEGAAAGTTVGVTAHSTDINGGAVTYSLAGDTSGGGFTVNATTGVVTVADPTKIDFESAPGHAYTETVQASDGTLTSSQTFTVGVTDVPPSTPVDSDAPPMRSSRVPPTGTTVGITAPSTDINGPAVTYSLDRRHLGRRLHHQCRDRRCHRRRCHQDRLREFAARATATRSSRRPATARMTSSQTFTIGVTDAPPSVPVDSDATANSVVEGAAAATTVGVTAHATDINGPARDLIADRRHVRRRLHHQCHDRRHHRRRSHQDRLREFRRRRTTTPSPRRPATARMRARRSSPSASPTRRHRPRSTSTRPVTPSWKAPLTALPSASPRTRPTSTAPP